ncbi:MAG: N-acetylmuramoyl-L-alanine amidase [Myxococcales bacterium]|nr:N-acetylmuramoyl-L-alanine amidase [Myxococcales bacterium]
MLRLLVALGVCAALTWALSGDFATSRARREDTAAAIAGKAATLAAAPSMPATTARTVGDDSRIDTGLGAARGPVIVLDPGHGGSNHGALAIVPSVLEKQLTLAIATQTATRLRAAGYTVYLTREDDRALTLRERLAFGENVNATLFVSIHANASQSRQQHGFETYVLSARAIDVDAPALRHDLSRPRPGIDPTTAMVLDDIERGVSQWRSIDVAERVQLALAQARPNSPNRGIRQESQHVLLGATMPAILVEVGFIDHPREGRELMQPPVQGKIAEALANAMSAWMVANKLGPTRP